MILSKRLQAIFDMVPPGNAADIGADHGYLIVSLIENNRISHGVAIENKKGPFNHLLQTVKSHHLEDKIDVLLSDGISEIDSSINTLIIAGMGGNTILDILTKNQHKLKYVDCIIVDAHNSIKKLREQINKMGFAIADETMVEEDNIFYEIIKFIRSDNAVYSPNDFEFGPILRQEKSATFKQKYINRLAEIERISNKKDLPAEKLQTLKQEAVRIRGIL